MDGKEWGLYAVYEIIFNRRDGNNNYDFDLTWEESKTGVGNNEEW